MSETDERNVRQLGLDRRLWGRRADSGGDVIRRRRIGGVLGSRYGFGVVLVVTCVSGTWGATTVHGQTVERANQAAIQTATVFSSLSVQRNTEFTDFIGTTTLSDAERSDLDADVAALRAQHHVVGLEIWDGQGRLLYADKDHPDAEQALPRAELDRTAVGQPWVAHSQDGGVRDVRTIDVFLPYQAQPGAAPHGLVEILIPEADISNVVAASTRRLLMIFLLALAFVVGGSVWLRHGLLRREHQARHDQLTGLLNRQAFGDLLEAAKSGDRASAEQSRAVLVLGIDRFRTINDTLGYAAGDLLLTQIGHQIERCRRSDSVARLGGDQFAMLLTELPDAATADAMGRQLLARLRAASFNVEGVDLSVDASIGIAMIPPQGAPADDLLRQSDIAMYQAKRAGTNVVTYNQANDPSDLSQLQLLVELRRAIDNNELVLHYQPKAGLIDGQVNGVEALVRWQHPIRGLLFPAAFIPLAENTGLIQPLTQWVLTHAIDQAARWHRAGRPLEVAVNISPRSLLEASLPTTVLSMLAAAKLPSRLLEIEITETAVMADPVAATRILTQLRAIGVRLSIDDFGAGYTSLAYLQSLPVDMLKIDRSFVSEICDNEGSAAITKAIIDLGHRLGLIVIAEGIETEPTWHLLQELGCDQGQGFLLAQPMTANQLDTWLTVTPTIHPHSPSHRYNTPQDVTEPRDAR